MGYESKLYVVRKGHFADDDGMRYAEVVAMIDLCKCYPLADKFRKMPKTDCYIYASDGNTRIVEDMYGEPLTEATISKAVEIVEAAKERCGDYYRLDIALSLLKAAQAEWDGFAVLHYGY